MPGAANRILTMAEKQSDHRQTLESNTNNADINRAYAGVACGFIITVLAFVIGGYLIFHGHDGAGATIIVSDLALLVGVFVYGTQTRKAQLETKRNAHDQLTTRRR